ncbi:hypothetical protein BD626DRAFT_460720 [Schizophyllum amplum]|uniref:Uncharacterized protein n=1 Tax=Schizophyllum amplum TaxID=97359 RepID=A0A550C7N3_9AGAR|nr:hypothetical protein BD626DRAFT_460720 [Auriculariopsis ampla]
MGDEHRTPLCPNCERSIACTGSFVPAHSTLDAIRMGDILDDASCRAAISRAEQAEKEARAYIREIIRLRSLANTLETDHQGLVQYAQQQRAIADPIRRLPAEILRLIFRHACADAVLTCPLDRAALTALRISHVCHGWRGAALSDSQLWAPTIHIDSHALDDIYCVLDDEQLFQETNIFDHMLFLFLSRSKLQPLNVILADDCRYDAREPEEYSRAELLDERFFSHFFRRCQRLSLCFAAHDYISSEYSPERSSQWRPRYPRLMPLLESVEITDSPGYNLSEKLFEQAPRLTFWKHSGVDLGFMNIPLSQLTRLETTWEQATTVYVALPQCTSLQEFTVRLFNKSETAYASPSQKISLPNLRTLDVVVADPRILGDLLRVLVAPRLEMARIGSDKYMDSAPITSSWDWPQDELERFVERSRCRLASMQIDQWPVSTEHRRRLRQLLPPSAQLVVNAGVPPAQE